MTILQLKYVITVAASTSLREAASKLYISQPALSTTLRELEEELGIILFDRTNKGITLTDAGREFLTYAKQAVSQYELIEERYLEGHKDTKNFSVSMQHYVFAVHAFVNTIKRYDDSKYTYSVYETRTEDVLDDVRNMKSEIGIISYSSSNEKILNKLFKDYQLEFEPLMTRDTYAYVWKTHPLADRTELSIKDLEKYPCVTFEQNGDSDFYLSEEALGDYIFDKVIKTTDRATTSEMLASLNGYSIGTGIMTDSITLKDEVVCIKLKEQDPLTIGYIKVKSHMLSDIGKTYIEELIKYKDQRLS